MTLRIMADAKIPLSSWPPIADAINIYVGGNNNTPWTDQQIAELPPRLRWRLPCWVYGPGRNGEADGEAFEGWLDSHGVPNSALVLLDMETWVDRGYVQAFDSVVRRPTALYGSIYSLFANPQLDGWDPADWTGFPHLFAHAGVLITQYAAASLGQTSGYQVDLSVLAPQAQLWDWAAGAPPKPATTTVTVGTWAPDEPWNSTLDGIAAHYGTTLDELLALNPTIHDANLIYPGEQIIVPDTTMPQSPQNNVPRETTVTVAPWRSVNPPWNSTMSGIAEHEGVTLDALLALNPEIKDPNVIHPGEQIVVTR